MKGNNGINGGDPGDLIIVVLVKPDHYFRRDGYDIYSDAFLTISQVFNDSLNKKLRFD